MPPSFNHHQVNGIRMRVAEQGSGPLVVFCHGWPESWYSWRHQLDAVAAAGFRAVAPDMRGYGGTDAPAEIEQYSILHLVTDIVELVQALGETQAVVVGHDWGAPVAWHCALLRPDMFRAVVGMSVPYTPPNRTDVLAALERRGITQFYTQYFQKPGVAEAEVERDVRDALARIFFCASGDGPEGKGFSMLKPGLGLLGNTVLPDQPLPWLTDDDLDYYTAEFQRAGFRGGFNWYRNLGRNWQLTGPWRGRPIEQPSLFIAGERDGVLRFPASAAHIDAFAQTLPGLRGCHILPGAGHWVQRERADAVNTLLVEFLRGL